MRALIVPVILILFLAACSSDTPPDELPPVMNGSINDTVIDSGTDGSDTTTSGTRSSNPDGPDRPNASTFENASVPANTSDPMNASQANTSAQNVSDPWVLGADEAGDPLIVEPRARLNESFLGLVSSSDPTPRIVSFTLINAGLHRPIAGFENMTGRVLIDRARVPYRLAVRANYAGDVGSVLFGFDGDENHRVENAPPFALHGVSEFGVYAAWSPDVGRHDITATAYDGPDGIGSHRDPVTLTLEFYSEGYLDRVPNP